MRLVSSSSSSSSSGACVRACHEFGNDRLYRFEVELFEVIASKWTRCHRNPFSHAFWLECFEESVHESGIATEHFGSQFFYDSEKLEPFVHNAVQLGYGVCCFEIV